MVRECRISIPCLLQFITTLQRHTMQLCHHALEEKEGIFNQVVLKKLGDGQSQFNHSKLIMTSRTSDYIKHKMFVSAQIKLISNTEGL